MATNVSSRNSYRFDNQNMIFKFHCFTKSMICLTIVFLGRGPKVIKLFSCSTQLSVKFQLLIKLEYLKLKFSSFQYLRCCIYHADKCYIIPIIVEFYIYEHAQLS